MFKDFARSVENKFDKMAKDELYTVEASKDDVWEKYLNSFPEGTNNVFRERREYDCQYCKNFVRQIGNVVAIKNGKLVSVWDVKLKDATYQKVVDKVAKYVKSKAVNSVFRNKEKVIGHRHNVQLLENGETLEWNHFACVVPDKFAGEDFATKRGDINQTQQVVKRGLDTITRDAAETVLELIDQNSLYRGEEFRTAVGGFLALKRKYEKLKNEKAKTIFAWENMKSAGARIRNSAMGTLLVDISEGLDLTSAVKSFEAKVAPANYKRPTALVTKGMIEKAVKKIEELGIEDSLHRRFANINDVSVNNVLFVDRSVVKNMKDSLVDTLMAGSGVKTSTGNFDKVEEIGIEDFVENVLPKAETLEVLVKNRHIPNLVSLVAPKIENSPNIFKWGNGFSWSYNGGVADSIKERVKDAGGNVGGVLRFSIQWNEKREDKSNDLDAHCKTPKGNTIYYGTKHDAKTGGSLDVDIMRPENKTAVENITWPNLSKMTDGNYKFTVVNYSGKNVGGFRAEDEFNGEVHTFDYDSQLNDRVDVAVVTKKNGGFTIKHKLPAGESSKDVWGIKTEQFQKVESLMYSPNHWDGEKTGNRHYMFMLENCVNPEETRGIYNEFLKNELAEHRKVFEILGNKMKCEHTENQLSGVGFSSTARNELICKVTGSFTRTLKIKF